MWKTGCLLLLIMTVELTSGSRSLSRKKRYLLFPEGSNFVMTMSFVKALMANAPKGINVLGECDVPFKLPSDPRLFRKRHNLHRRQRRDVFSGLETLFNSVNLNGESCVKRILCEMDEYVKLEDTNSMIKDMLVAVFTLPERQEKYGNYCHESTFLNCAIPLLELLLGSSSND